LKFKKISGITPIIVILVSFVLFVSFLAIIWNANRLLKSKVESYLGKNFSIESISAGWGKIEISNLKVRDLFGREVGRTELVTLKADFFDLLRKRYTISEVRIINPFFLIETDDKGKPIFPSIIKDQKKEGERDTRKERTERTPLLVKKAQILNGSIDYVDKGLKGQPQTIKLRNVDLEVKNISYPFGESFILFNLRADIPGPTSKGRMTGKGKMNMLRKDTESTLALKNLDVKILEPYYRKARSDLEIEKGLIDIDLSINISSGMINAPCKLVIRDLKLAESSNLKRRLISESLKATLSLLKNEKGEIVFDFVIGGKIDDPHFNLREEIIRGIITSLGKKIGALLPNFPRKGIF